MICDLGSAHNREVNYNPLLAVPPLNHQARIGEGFIDLQHQRGADMSGAMAFSEVFENVIEGVPQPDLPIGLIKSRKSRIIVCVYTNFILVHGT